MRAKKGEREEEDRRERVSEAVRTREPTLNRTESTGRSVDRYAWDDVLVRAFFRRGAGICCCGPPRKMLRANERETLRQGRRRVLGNGGRRPGSVE